MLTRPLQVGLGVGPIVRSGEGGDFLNIGGYGLLFGGLGNVGGFLDTVDCTYSGICGGVVVEAHEFPSLVVVGSYELAFFGGGGGDELAFFGGVELIDKQVLY
ncbi:hypothetical protein MKW98_001600 [Papaver atlanticum]|uniref:Uncharacterized protein n=1 Tax=Papaver atlanticum TaxID=357466 RepID=A0AAD4S8E3_9MAGN|nr:hypothetical protein MKW98_001600 [Papaver atlanticum]